MNKANKKLVPDEEGKIKLFITYDKEQGDYIEINADARPELISFLKEGTRLPILADKNETTRIGNFSIQVDSKDLNMSSASLDEPQD